VTRSTLGRGRERRCLGPELTAYADRVLCPDELRSWDLHLVACTACRQAVEAERRVLAALRGSTGPAVPSDLRAVLLSMASTAASPEVASPAPRSALPTGSSTGFPNGSYAAAWAAEPQPLRIPPPPVPVVDRCAPAQHRSVMRATVFAGLAAGASAAAAWSFAVVGTPLVPTGPAPVTPGTAVQRARPVTPSATSASFGSSSFGASLRARAALPASATTVVFGGAGRPVVSGAQRGSAESLP
jgi:hypothetical protein